MRPILAALALAVLATFVFSGFGAAMAPPSEHPGASALTAKGAGIVPDFGSPSTYPNATVKSEMVYDAASGAVVMFDTNGVTWAYHAGVWSIASNASHGPTRYMNSTHSAATFSSITGVGLAYDYADNYVLLFGGDYTLSGACSTLCGTLNGYTNQTWALSYSASTGDYTWTNLTASTLNVGGHHPPSPRQNAVMGYDGADGYTVLVGGASLGTYGFGLYNETWKWSSGKWTEVSSTLPAIASCTQGKGNNCGFSTESYSNRMTGLVDNGTYVLLYCTSPSTPGLFDTYAGGTWSNSGIASAVSANPSAGSAPLYNASMAYDPAIGAPIVWGSTYSTSGSAHNSGNAGVWRWSEAASSHGWVNTTAYLPAVSYQNSQESTYDAAPGDGYILGWQGAIINSISTPIGYGYAGNVTVNLRSSLATSWTDLRDISELTGRVTNAATGAAIVGATVTGTGLLASHNAFVSSASSTTDAQGWYNFSVENGTASGLTVNATYYTTPASAHPTIALTTTYLSSFYHNFTMAQSLAITATTYQTAVLNGSAVAFKSTATGGSGSYAYYWTFGDGHKGSHYADPSHAYNSTRNAGFTATLTVNDTSTPVQTASATVNVKVFTSGTPGLVAHPSSLQSGAVASIFLNVSGGFQTGANWTGLPSACTLNSGSNGTEATCTVPIAKGFYNVSATSFDRNGGNYLVLGKATLTLYVAPSSGAGLSVSGTTVDYATNTTIPYAHVAVSEYGVNVTWVAANATGVYTVSGLVSGTYHVNITATGYTTTQLVWSISSNTTAKPLYMNATASTVGAPPAAQPGITTTDIEIIVGAFTAAAVGAGLLIWLIRNGRLRSKAK